MGTAPRDFSGRDVIKVLRDHNYRIVDRTGSHVKLRYENPDTGEVRVVSVPMHDSISIGTLRNIADQAEARDFEAFCRWVDRNK